MLADVFLSSFSEFMCPFFLPVNTVLLGQAGDWGRFTGRLTGGPTIPNGCRGYSIYLSVVGGVFVQVLDLQLAAAHSCLIPHDSLITDNLLQKEETDKKRKL